MKTTEATLTLQVTEAQAKDMGRAIARIDPKDMAKLHLEIGDIVEIQAKRKTVAKVMPSFSSPVKPETLAKSFKAGILEIRFEKK